MSRYPFTRRNCRSATSMPAAVHRAIILSSRHRLTLRMTSRAMEIIDSTGFVVYRVRDSVGGRPSPVTVRVSSRPSRREEAVPGWCASRRSARARKVRSARWVSSILHALSSWWPTKACCSGGRWSMTFRRLWTRHLATSPREPNTLRTALRRPLPPSITRRIPPEKSRPRSTMSESRARHTVAFSVVPSRTPRGCLRPWSSTPRPPPWCARRSRCRRRTLKLMLMHQCPSPDSDPQTELLGPDALGRSIGGGPLGGELVHVVNRVRSEGDECLVPRAATGSGPDGHRGDRTGQRLGRTRPRSSGLEVGGHKGDPGQRVDQLVAAHGVRHAE